MENNNNIGLGFNYNKFKIWFVVFAIAVPVIVIITLTHQNSKFELFERFSFSNDKVRETTRVPNNNNGNNVTSQNLGGRDPNVTTLMFQNDTSDGNFDKTFSQVCTILCLYLGMIISEFSIFFHYIFFVLIMGDFFFVTVRRIYFKYFKFK